MAHKESLFIIFRVEVRAGQVDPEHAENIRSPDTAEPPHDLDGLDQEEIPGAAGWQIQGEDEVPKDNERRDHAESSRNEVSVGVSVSL